jgi:hypothetical protein
VKRLVRPDTRLTILVLTASAGLVVAAPIALMSRILHGTCRNARRPRCRRSCDHFVLTARREVHLREVVRPDGVGLIAEDLGEREIGALPREARAGGDDGLRIGLDPRPDVQMVEEIALGFGASEVLHYLRFDPLLTRLEVC